MNDIELMQDELERYKTVLDRIPKLQDEIRVIKRSYEESIASSLCENIANGGSTSRVMEPQIQYVACAATLKKLEDAREFANNKVRDLQAVLDVVANGVAAKRNQDDLKELSRKMALDPQNLKIRTAYIQHCTDVLGMNKKKAHESMERILDPLNQFVTNE
ncbi:MAG: hypothetical protein KQI78_12200 [Deltaproteobacteria bacterium]|nr:hypothetical protein [Deltaproteobacteria bacterium]